MVTTQDKTLTAYKALNMIRGKVKGKDGLTLFKLKNRLQEHLDFQREEEIRLVDEHNGMITPEGRIVIPDAEKRTDFEKVYKELLDMDVELDFEPPIISLERNSDITMEEIEMLDGFVVFE